MCTAVHTHFVCKHVAKVVRKWKAINWYSWYMKAAVFCDRVWISSTGLCAVKGRCTPIKATSEEPTCVQEFLPLSVWWSFCGRWVRRIKEPEAGGTALHDKWWSGHPCASVMIDIRWFDEQPPAHNRWIMLHPTCRSRQINGNYWKVRAFKSLCFLGARTLTRRKRRGKQTPSTLTVNWNGVWKLGSAFRTRIQAAMDGRTPHDNLLKRIQKCWLHSLWTCLEENSELWQLLSLNALFRWVRSAGNISEAYVHDSSRPHTLMRTTEAITQFGWTLLPHRPYSPEPVPSDRLFGFWRTACKKSIKSAWSTVVVKFARI